MRKKLFVNEGKRTVVTALWTKRGVFKGFAKCSEEDTFDQAVGENLSELRAKVTYTKKKIADFNKKSLSFATQSAHMAQLAQREKDNLEALMTELDAAVEATHGA